MFQKFKKIFTKIALFTLLVSVISPAISAQAGTGILEIQVNPEFGKYHIVNTVTGETEFETMEGSQTIVGFPTGFYEVVFEDISDPYVAPAPQPVVMPAGGQILVDGTYDLISRPNPTVVMNVSPSFASYEINHYVNPDETYLTGTGSQEFTGLDYGQYIVKFGSLGEDYITPQDLIFTINLETPNPLVISGVYEPVNPLGTINMVVNPNFAEYTIRDASAPTVPYLQGVGSQTFEGLELGSYLVEFTPVDGYITPDTATVTLDTNNRHITVFGTYEPLVTSGSITVNVNPEIGGYTIKNNTTQQVVADRTGSDVIGGLDFGEYLVEFKSLGVDYVTPPNEVVTLNTDMPNVTVNANYVHDPQTGSIVLNVINQDGDPIIDGQWEIRACDTPNLSSCDTLIANGTANPAPLTDKIAGLYYGAFFELTDRYASVFALTENPQLLTGGDTITFTIQYMELDSEKLATIHMTTTGDQGDLGADIAVNGDVYLNGNLIGPAPTNLILDVTQQNIISFGDNVAHFTPPTPITFNANQLFGGMNFNLNGLYSTEIARIQVDALDENDQPINAPIEIGPSGNRTAFDTGVDGNPFYADINVVENANEIFCGAIAGYSLLSNPNPFPVTGVNAGTVNDDFYACRYDRIEAGIVEIEMHDNAVPANPVSEDWTLYEGTDNSGDVYQTGNGTDTLLDVPVGNYFLEAANQGGYASVTITPSNPQAVVDQQTTTFDVEYELQPQTGTIHIEMQDNAVPANPVDEDWTLYEGTDDSGDVAATGTGSEDVANLAEGNYFLEVENQGGFAGFTISPNNPQAVVASQVTTFNVTYTLQPQLGIVEIVMHDNAVPANPVNEDWTLYEGIDNSGAVYQTGNGTDTINNVPAGDYFLEAENQGGFASVTITPNNPQTVVDQQTTTFEVEYELQAQAGTIQIDLHDNAVPANPVDENWTLYEGTDNTGTVYQTGNGTATINNVPVGDYFLEVENTGGFVGTIITPNNPQTVTDQQTTTFDVEYTLAPQPDMTISEISLGVGQTATEQAPVDIQVDYANLDTVADAEEVVVTIDYDEARSAVTDPGTCTDSGTELTCTIGTVAASATGSITFVLTPNSGTAGQNIPVIATVTTTNGDTDTANDSLTFNVMVDPTFSVTKTADKQTVGDGEIIQYTIRVDRNATTGGDIDVEISDSITGASTLAGANGGEFTYRLNTTDTNDKNVSCTGSDIATSPINCTFTDTPGRYAVITYEVMSDHSGVPADQTSLVTNTATIEYNTQTLTDDANVTLQGPVTQGGGGGGSAGPSSGGGGGGYKRFVGEMKLGITKLVSTDGENFVSAHAPAYGFVVPERESTRVYTKVTIQNLGQVTASSIQLQPFFKQGDSDMTADEIENLSGARFKNGHIVIDKIPVGKAASFTYSRLVAEHGENDQPAIDGLTLTHFRSKLPRQQDNFTYVGIGLDTPTYLFAGRIPNWAKQVTEVENTSEPSTLSQASEMLRMVLTASTANANVGDPIDYTLTVTNVSTQDLSNLYITHDYADVLTVEKAMGGRDNGRELTWKRAILRPGEEAVYNFTAKVMDGSEAAVRSTTRALANEADGLPVIENFIDVSGQAKATRSYRLVQTGPMGILIYLMLLSTLVYFGAPKVRKLAFARA